MRIRVSFISGAALGASDMRPATDRLPAIDRRRGDVDITLVRRDPTVDIRGASDIRGPTPDTGGASDIRGTFPVCTYPLLVCRLVDAP